MPKVQSSQETERFDLESAPPDGYVVLRKFSYGEKVKIRSLTARVHIAQAEVAKKQKEARQKGEDIEDLDAEMSFDMEAVLAYKFKKAIVQHNLEDAKGRKLDFKSRSDFHLLDEAVGEEIEDSIEEYNPETSIKEADEGEESPLATASAEPSSTEGTSQET